MRRILLALPILVLAGAGLAGCTLPGRQGQYSKAPSLVDVRALTSFDGRVPLVTIPAHTPDWSGSVKYAVNAALKIKPSAQFRVYVTAPPAGSPQEARQQMAELAPEAAQVANAIVADGVQPQRVTLGASTDLPRVKRPAAPEILVFAK